MIVVAAALPALVDDEVHRMHRIVARVVVLLVTSHVVVVVH